MKLDDVYIQSVLPKMGVAPLSLLQVLCKIM